MLPSTLGSIFCALRKTWLASKCLLAVSITLRMAPLLRVDANTYWGLISGYYFLDA